VASESPEGVPEEVNTSTALTVQLPPEQAALLVGVRNADLYASLVPPDYELRPMPVQDLYPSLPGLDGVTIYEEENPGQ